MPPPTSATIKLDRARRPLQTRAAIVLTASKEKHSWPAIQRIDRQHVEDQQDYVDVQD
jgi:hypothetical protein